MKLLALLLILVLPGGHHYQKVQDFVTVTLQGYCDSGELCSVNEITLKNKFASPDYTCYGNQMVDASGVDAEPQFYPFDRSHIDVFFWNNSEDPINKGKKIKLGFVCEGLQN